MAENIFSEIDVVCYLESGSATEAEVNYFQDRCVLMCTNETGDSDGKRKRYMCNRLWAKLLRMRRTPPTTRFIYEPCLKDYHLTGGVIIDADPYVGAVRVTGTEFVKFVVKHLDDAL